MWQFTFTFRLARPQISSHRKANIIGAAETVPWTPEQLVSMSKLINGDGQWLGEQLYETDLVDQVDTVVALAMPHAEADDRTEEQQELAEDEQGDFLLELYRFGGTVTESWPMWPTM